MMPKNKTLWWYIRNSLWVLLALVPWLYWLPFLHIGKRVQNKRYKIMGYVHLAVFICLFVGFFTAIGVACLLLLLLQWCVAFIQCLVLLKKYWIALAQRESKQKLEQLIQRAPEEGVQPAREVTEERNIPAQKLNVNTCTEEQLCALPGISIVEAKKMTALRESHGDYATVEEFIMVLGIKPHVAVRIVDSLYAEPSAAPVVSAKGAGRILDF